MYVYVGLCFSKYLYSRGFSKNKIMMLPVNPIPYMNKMEMEIQYQGSSNYQELVGAYDPAFAKKLASINPNILAQQIYIFMIQLQPEDLEWRIWKNKTEIQDFIRDIHDDVHSTTPRSEIHAYSDQLSCNVFNKQIIPVFLAFLNAITRDPFLSKSQDFLLFIEHCVPVDKWNMMIFKQMEVLKPSNILDKAQSILGLSRSKPQRDYFLTITRDGILKSDNHLLESRITFMIAFTKNLTIQCGHNNDQQITFIIQSCAHEELVIHFYKYYNMAINFTVALRMALDHSSYCGDNRFGSFSPVRSACASKLYVDGGQYYQDMYDELVKAKKQVCMTGWMITPYFLLKRPNKIDAKQYRLDGVLQSLAERGVKVYIIVFMEPKIALNNDSEHVQIYLQSLHDNIKVFRHPNGAIPILWSHHQKMVIIDQSIAFMGGLDICYGRWDFCKHPLTDLGDLWDGADYNNYRTKDISNPRNYKQSNLNKNFQIRLPWHDIALQIRGDAVIDLLRHFVQYWYFVKSQLNVDPMKMMNFLKKRYEQAFYNATNQTSKQIHQYYIVEINKRQEAITLGEKIKFMFNGREERKPELLIETNPGKIVGNDRLQICRSSSMWSIGLKNHESSIHEAYIDLITKSKKFIYIENQFFMGLQNRVVECLVERITRAHMNRATNKDQRDFKVIVIMPLLPAFEGNIADPASSVLRIQVHYEYQAILRGQKSLFKCLRDKQIQPSDYVHFFGLRNCEIVADFPKTEIIYVHSKLMIVDDERCIIGSANINDRSLLGNRDSELACVIENCKETIYNFRQHLFKQHFGLSQYQIQNFTNNELTNQVNGRNMTIWQYIVMNSTYASEFYHRYFRCVPCDYVFNSAGLNKYRETLEASTVGQFRQDKAKLMGHAVNFPLSFMKDEDLTFRVSQKEYFAPQISFT